MECRESKMFTIIGCGDIGQRVGKALLAQNQDVSVTSHFDEGRAALEDVGFKVIVANFDYQDDIPDFSIHSHRVFYFLPPQGGGNSDYRMLNFCRRINAQNCPEKMVYISTSGVYGDCGDDLVTEETPVNPQTSRAKRRVSAETQLRECAERFGFDLVILRVTGIYGPGRLPIAQLTKGHQVLRQADSPRTNRIHSLDLVRICVAAMERGENGDIVNVCDGQESSMSEYFMSVAKRFDLPLPKELSREEAEQVMNPLTLSFLKESRKMTNKKLLDKLAVELLYPTLSKGLEACEVTL